MVSGIGAASLDVVKGFYDGLVQTTVPVSAPKVAELIKNTFRHVNITLVNEMAMLAKPPGVKIWEAIQAGPVALQSVDRARDCVALAVVGLVGRHGSRVSGVACLVRAARPTNPGSRCRIAWYDIAARQRPAAPAR